MRVRPPVRPVWPRECPALVAAGLGRAGCAGERIVRGLGLGKGDDLPDRAGAGHQHRDPIEPEGDAAVRRTAELQRIEEESEFLPCFVLVDAEHANTACWTSRRCMRTDPPPISDPLSTMSYARDFNVAGLDSISAVSCVSGAVNGWWAAVWRRSRGSHSNSGKSTTHRIRQPSSTRPRSSPSFTRSAPSESLTIFDVSAPKKMRSPSLAAVRSMIRCSASSDRNLTIGDCSPSRAAARLFTLI